MDKLWAPWRMEYIRAKKDNDEGCIFCIKAEEEKDRENLVLYRGELSFVLMNLYPYNNGHLMICPYEHVETTESLNKEGMSEIMVVADAAMVIFKKKMKAQGFNFGANIGVAGGAGIADHIHFHLVPRWVGDTNFMPVVSHTKVLVDGLLETYDKLKPEFDKLH
ncbi:HIT domain-containing protein [Caldithrix abyssi]|nr:HIT domain-containing protein [Caldithrix abyssi]